MRYESFVGLRYAFSRRQDNFVSTISVISMIGIALSVAALIVVLSVVNGFEREFRDRMLGATAHVQVSAAEGRLADWPSLAERLTRVEGVAAVAPSLDAQAMLSSGSVARGALLHGIDPAREPSVSDLGTHLIDGSLDRLRAGQWGVMLGVDLAQALGVAVGERIALVVPRAQGPGDSGNISALAPRLRELEVVGLISVGLYQIDSTLALMHMADVAAIEGGTNDDARAADLARLPASALRLRLSDPMVAASVAHAINRDLAGLEASPWTKSQGHLFQAVHTSKAMLALVLALIVAVAAFNIVATLVMAVVDKTADIAILRTLGASPGGVLRIFMTQGVMIGVAGTLAGVVLGIVLALNVGTAVASLEGLLGFRFLSAEVYQISQLPAELRGRDVLLTALAALGLSFVATLYPSWRAARVAPAEALRDE
jgi:lipoprotein-releasing system permease protein